MELGIFIERGLRRENIIYTAPFVAQKTQGLEDVTPGDCRGHRGSCLALHHNAFVPPVADAHQDTSIDNGGALNVKLREAMEFAV